MVAPTVGQRGGIEIDAVDAEAVEPFEGRELADDAVDQVSEGLSPRCGRGRSGRGAGRAGHSDR